MREINSQSRQQLFAAIRAFPGLRTEEKREKLVLIEELRDTLRARERDAALSTITRQIAGRYADQADIPICTFRLELDLPVA